MPGGSCHEMPVDIPDDGTGLAGGATQVGRVGRGDLRTPAPRLLRGTGRTASTVTVHAPGAASTPIDESAPAASHLSANTLVRGSLAGPE